MLGTVEVDGVGRNGHGPRTAQLAALIYFPSRTQRRHPVRRHEPLKPWSTTTLNARIQGLLRALSNDPDGDPYVPRRRNGDTPYRLADNVRCDWTRFLQLAERGLARAADGLPDLEEALSLVRGRPFGVGRPDVQGLGLLAQQALQVGVVVEDLGVGPGRFGEVGIHLGEGFDHAPCAGPAGRRPGLGVAERLHGELT